MIWLRGYLAELSFYCVTYLERNLAHMSLVDTSFYWVAIRRRTPGLIRFADAVTSNPRQMANTLKLARLMPYLREKIEVLL